MKPANKKTALICSGLAICTLLVAAAARGQDASFEGARNFDVGAGPQSVALGDFNGDGLQDLVVANVDSNSVSVLLGNGDGSFQTGRNFTTGDNPFFVAVGDFNGDGWQDLAVANSGSAN